MACLPGALVRVTDSRGKFLGTALYSSSSQIAIRMISHDPVADLPALVAERIRAAIAYRERVVADSNAYRVVFSEARFSARADRRSLQRRAVGTDPDAGDGRGTGARGGGRNAGRRASSRPELWSAWMRAFASWSNCRPRKSGLLRGEKSSTVIAMNGGKQGVRFHYDGLEGQKTGAFLDQRENYAAAAQYAHGEALDVFCYQGGFALHLAAKCSAVTGVDSSRPALEMAEKNAVLNGREVEWIEGNAFDLLKDYAAGGNGSTTPSCSILRRSPRASTTSTTPCADTKNSICGR